MPTELLRNESSPVASLSKNAVPLLGKCHLDYKCQLLGSRWCYISVIGNKFEFPWIKEVLLFLNVSVAFPGGVASSSY